MWRAIVNDLDSYLRGLAAFADYDIGQGLRQRKDYPAVDVVRGDVKDQQIYEGFEKGTVVFYVDVFIKYSGPEPSEAYSQLNDVETAVYGAVQAWGELVTGRLNVADIYVRVPALFSDGDTYRPEYGSRFVIEAEFNKLGY